MSQETVINVLALIIVLMVFALAFFAAMYRRAESERKDVAKTLIRVLDENRRMSSKIIEYRNTIDKQAMVISGLVRGGWKS